MGVAKFVYGNEVKFDLTGDTLTKDKALKGYTFHDAKGDAQTGTCEFDVDSSDVTAKVAEVLAGKTYAAQGAIKTGTMPNNGAVAGTISTKAGVYNVPQGYHDGSGKVQIASAEQAKIIATNIRQGVTILGVEGTMSGTEGAKAQSKTATPSTVEQTILPDAGYNYLSQVKVAPIPYRESTNSSGGITITIG